VSFLAKKAVSETIMVEESVVSDRVDNNVCTCSSSCDIVFACFLTLVLVINNPKKRM
jgi:hypothetical protein